MIALFIMAMPALNTSPDMREMLSAGLTRGMAWTSFFTLFFGWLAAMIGASLKSESKSVKVTESVQIRPAA